MSLLIDAGQSLELMKSRRSIRRYRPDPVPDELLEQVLDAGRWAPSASNRQPWSFVVVRDPEIRRQVAEYAAFFVVRWAHVGEAPVIIALCGESGNPAYRFFLHEDMGLAGAQIMLQARALGLGTCWVGGVDRKAIAAILKLPASQSLVGLITLGYPAEEPGPPKRKPLAALVHYDVFGNQSPEARAQAGQVRTGWLGILLRRFRAPLRF